MDKKYYTASIEQKDRIKHRLAELLMHARDIHFAYLFGSFIEKGLPFGDIDLGVYFAGKNRLQIAEAAIDLAVSLTRETGYPVDVRLLNNAPVSFVYNVLRGELINENNEDFRCQVAENTIRNYLDIKPILDIATKEAFSHEPQS